MKELVWLVCVGYTSGGINIVIERNGASDSSPLVLWDWRDPRNESRPVHAEFRKFGRSIDESKHWALLPLWIDPGTPAKVTVEMSLWDNIEFETDEDWVTQARENNMYVYFENTE